MGCYRVSIGLYKVSIGFYRDPIKAYWVESSEVSFLRAFESFRVQGAVGKECADW